MILQYVAQQLGVEAMPTFIFIKDGKAVDKVVGAKKDELQRKVAALATETSLVAQAQVLFDILYSHAIIFLK